MSALGYRAGEATQFRTLYDEQLGFECDLALDATGRELRCLPTRHAELVFVDAGCRDPGFFNFGQLKTGDWLSTVPLAATCPGDLPPHRQVFVVGEQLDDGAIVGSRSEPAYAQRGTSCVPTSAAAKADPPLFRLYPHPDEELAAAHVLALDVGHGLQVERAISEDGAELNLSVTLRDGAPCALQGSGQCVPEPIATNETGTMLDPSCEQRAYASLRALDCGTPRYGIESGENPRVFELETPGELYSKSITFPIPASVEELRSDCTWAGGGTGTGFFAPGKDVSDDLPTAQRWHVGSGALHLDVLGFGVGATNTSLIALQGQQIPGKFLDQAGKPCTALPAVDGTLRCLPDAATVTEADYFQDSACQQRLYYLYGEGGRPAVPTALDTLRIVDFGERGISALHSLTIYEGNRYEWSNESCIFAPSDGYVWLARAARLGIDTLPVVEETHL